jgi:hypothetical protein
MGESRKRRLTGVQHTAINNKVIASHTNAIRGRSSDDLSHCKQALNLCHPVHFGETALGRRTGKACRS